ncbi:uncharacterized protein LY89DRAFT_443229 [Mollisia scopiformis]|uniref:Uncharacterized protein n=1 Tax=Mollisia scopiformis TaxID=149040 RepID=A0A194XJY9_MOLSC|nr:uncharacterized protein LY89DRAFT_443229 [Mollisia scopiformis]KUJ20424.1 hypothetical protein LY89DRAFT_443229 [Mollisia scopiformis]
MAISDAVQTLSAAFSFGILLQAATGALFIYYRGHGSSIFQDGRRLVLVLFLLFAALWAQIDFVNLLLPATMATGCQATLIITTMFDQLARVGMEQFLLWSVGHGTRLTAERLILQGVLLARLVAGGLLVGFTRPQFEPVCVAETSVLPIAIIVLALDAIIVGVLLVRAASLGMFQDMSGKSGSEQSKALVLSIFGFGFWTAMSVPLILGIPTIILILRTVLPANGLLVLVGIVTMFPHALLSDREQITTPEARSPFVTPMPPSRQIFQENVNNDGSPISNHNYTKSGSLFVVNPSATPRDSPRGPFANSPRSDTRGFTKMSEEVTVREIGGRDAPERPNRPERNAPGYRGSSGVFPSMANAATVSALAPQIRPNITVNTKVISGPMNLGPSPAQQKRGLFNFNKTPTKPSVRSLGISQPVTLDTESGAQPFARMQTIDLATAALNERERREGATARAKLIANRPAPQPPTMSSQEALRKSISVKRKEMPMRVSEAMPTIPGSVSSSMEASGSSTSASLSPGRDDIRRRSPRQTNNFEKVPVIDAKTGKPVQLQRKNTLGGLPSNPRATRLMNPAPEPPKMTIPQQTVMFMNDIVYDNPSVVKTIIRDAPSMYAKRPKTATEKKGSFDSTSSLHSAGSIIHRPRPYKRDQSKDRAIFPSEPSPGHRRSRSGSGITPSRKSMFLSNPGSPSMLPPLPPPPTTAADLKRLLPNDTKSMTFDEKIELLFPAPPGGATTRQRRSSVPSLPRVPSVFMSDSPQAQSPTEEEAAARRASKRTTIAEFLVDTVPPTIPNKSAKRQSVKLAESERQAYRFSANTYRTIADEVGETWIPGIPAQDVEPRNALLGVPQRQSVLDDMRKSHFTVTTNADSEDDATTYWGSVHDDVPAVNISSARSTFIKPFDSKKSSTVPSIRTIDSEDAIDGEEIMTVMLESEENRQSFLVDNVADNNRRSFFLDAGEALPGDKTPSSINERGWHKRIGDELPTFSERKEMRKSRKMPPPTPLLLNRNGRQATVVVRPAEPSPPADSPERAIAEIQAQLKRFEEPGRGSVGSLIRGLPGGNESGTTMGTDRLRLLENLELEMGQQENHWQQMQNNLDRDSIASTSQLISPQPETVSESTMSRESSQRSSRTPSRVLSRRARIRSSMTDRSKGQMSSRTTSTESSDNSRASVWQQRLAEAQNEYMENAPQLLRKKSLNFLSVSKSHQLGSPTPPDSGESETDMETDAGTESESELEAARYQELLQAPRKDPATLWQQPLPTPKAAVGRMWNPPFESVQVRAASPEPPAMNVRPVQRRTQSALPISSTDLWSKPKTAANKRPVVALWGSKFVRPVSIVTRRVTQRPQRKSKRVTFLPDIVESPVPLPNKRDTLGIFQFPWGEKSDQPVYQPAFNPALLAGPALNANLEARARQLENSEQSEYSSSFFDDYDEDQDEMDPESDDDFDETTLWEIANLLNSKDVPSKQSLLPPARGQAIAEEFDESDDEDSAIPPPVMNLPIRPLAMNERTESQLWASQAESAIPNISTGLPQPEPSVWSAMVLASDDAVRSKARSSDALPVLSSRELWASNESEKSSPVESSMWQASKDISSPPSSAMWSPQPESTPTRESGLFTPVEGLVIRTTDATPAAIQMAKTPRPAAVLAPSISSRNLWTRLQNMEEATEWLSKSSAARSPRAQVMWAPTSKIVEAQKIGLFDATLPRVVFRTTTSAPAAINMICKPRTTRVPLSQLTSTKLWSGCNKLPLERDWISESSIRPESPSIYSASSSGNSSPASDSSSVKSTSTKASSLWGSVSALAIPTWWEGKSKKPADSSPVDDSKPASKIPVRQNTPLAPVRESRVLASRDMWEAKTPVLEKTPSRRFRRGTVAQDSAPVPHRALRHQYRPIVAFRANWDEALAEAIAAGTPKRSLPRPIARKADWTSALNEAITSSKPRLQRPQCSRAMWADALAEAVSKSRIPRPVKVQRYDPAVLHPVFFTKSLATSAKDIHPAAIGHASPKYDPAVMHPVFFTKSLITDIKDVHPAAIGHVTKKYDPSVLHPVFFTESLVSTTYDVHPAAIGHISKVIRPSMWTSSPVTAASKSGSMWSKESSVPRKAALEASIIAEPVRKVTVARVVELPILESKTFWQPANTVTVERNWMLSTPVQSPKTWTPRSDSSSQGSDISMWSAKATSSPSSPDMFTDMDAGPVRKATAQKGLDLPVLESKTFWQPTRSDSTERNWIQSAVVVSSKTWTPRSQSPRLQVKDSNSMWAANTTSSSTLPDMFANMKGGLVKKASPSRPSALPRLNSNELFGTGSGSAERNIHWLHNTSTLPSRALTWTAPSTCQATLPESSMWEARPHINLPSATLFENAHSQPWNSKKREETSLSQLESTDMWRPNMFIPTSPRNWLVKRRFSKVEFRY